MLDKLETKIANNVIFQADYFKIGNVDELLDMRDEEEFDSEWMRVYDFLNKIEIEECEQEKINDIRKNSFIMAYNLSESSDIASCVSDDFEIICKAYICDYNDGWLNALIMCYARGEFPCGQLQTLEYDVKECINNMFN